MKNLQNPPRLTSLLDESAGYSRGSNRIGVKHMSLRQSGTTIAGILIGLVLGLVVAVLVAIFVTKAPVPFVNKAPKTGERSLEPKTAADAPDPNKPLQGKNAKTSDPSGQTAQTGAAPENKDSILGLLGSLGKENTPAQKDAAKADASKTDPTKADVTKSDATKQDPSKSAKASDTKTDSAKADAAKPADPDGTRYLLQAGAFRERDDAEAMKGKLALLGMEARISTIERDGNTIYRVRTGPYKQLDDANSVRKRMADGGVETSLVPIRQQQ